MKKRIVTLIAVGMLVLAYAVPASAHTAGPCNGEGTGHDYAKHHISAMAKDGGLGNDGHKPGAHKGFSVCNPSGK